MLDGKKSYLISITALFSKKGYELAFGTDMILDTQRDTRYHLSAPVNSTYRTLRQDTLKNASKAPYSATSLFGGNWKEAAIAGEFEGQTVEAVHSTIVSYLSDIHRHFRGEIRQKAQQPSRFTASEARWKMGGKIHSMGHADSIQQGDRQKSIQADFIVNAVQEKDAVSQMRLQAETSNGAYEIANVLPAYEGLLDAGSVSEQRQGNGSPSSESAIHGETVIQGETAEQQTVIQQIFQDRAAVVELPVAAKGLAMESISQPAGEALPHQTDIRDALIETSRPGAKGQILDLDEINDLTKAGKREQVVGTTPNDVLETEASAKNDHAPVEARAAKSDKSEGAFIDWQMLVEQRPFKDSANERSTAASMGSGTGAGHERMRATELKQDKFMMIHETGTGNRIYLSDAAEPQDMLKAEHGIFSIQPENTSSITADPMMGSVTGSPEMGTLSEGIRSVYGEYAAKMAEAGMENILSEGLQHVDVPAAPSSIESVIHRMQETSNSGSLEGIQGHSIVGSMEFSGRMIGAQTETFTSGLASSSRNSLNESMSVASYNKEQACPAGPDQYRVASTYDNSKVMPEEQSITAFIHSSADADNEHLSSGIPEHDATIGDSQRGERVLASQEGELNDLGSARLNGLELEGQYEELLAAEVLREIIAESPEISKMARMLRIMYGEQAMELIEAGIKYIVVKAVKEGTTQTSIHQITDSVIHQLETSLASGSLGAVQTRSDQAYTEHTEGTLQTSAEQGSKSPNEEGLLISSESGNSFSSCEGAYHAMGDAERHTSAEAEIQALDKALMNPNSTNAITQDIETGRTFSSITGVTESMEQGILSGSLPDGEYIHLERAAMSTGNLNAAESGPLESAQYIGELEAERSEVTTGELLEQTKEADVASSEHALVYPDIQEGVINSGTYADNQEHNQVSDAILLDGDQAVPMESVQETNIDQIDRSDSIMRTYETVVEQTNGTGNQVENVLEAVWIHQERANGEETEYIGVRDGLETAQPGDISKMVDMPELEQGQAIKKRCQQ
ncbi:hypothetical protein ACFQY3_23755 [Paenibacillus farraposensis]|uniref:hypothetical protein n=1 Tax=Paenibacillus farraposensis TaxID=2807095 RepID=UPI00361ACB22